MWTLLAILAGAYLGFVALLFFTQRSMLFHPDSGPVSPASVGLAEMTIERLRAADGVEILAWWRPAVATAAPVLLYLHGNAGHVGHRAAKVRPYLDRGWGVLLLSWRGYGGSDGRPSEAGFYADADAGRAFLAARGIGHDRLVIYGESIGSGPAVKLAANDAPAALVLEAPFTSIADLAQAMFPYLPVRPLVRDRFASIERIGAVAAPLLVLHGERDATVPASHGHALLAAHPGPKQGHFLTHAGHNDLYDFGIVDIVVQFISSQMDIKSLEK